VTVRILKLRRVSLGFRRSIRRDQFSPDENVDRAQGNDVEVPSSRLSLSHDPIQGLFPAGPEELGLDERVLFFKRIQKLLGIRHAQGCVPNKLSLAAGPFD
jgi:hypothetical protein